MGNSKKGRKSLIPDTAANPKKANIPTLLSAVESKLLSFESNDTEPYVNLKYFDPGYQCLSEWTPDELKCLSSFICKVTESNWPEIYRTGGKNGSKVGLGYMKHPDRKKLPDNEKLKNISPEIDFIELRVTQGARVHGFRTKSAFFLVWLDRNHQVYPM